ncbi:MAG: adenine-specific methyltransferase EcoRI family protein [Planctomycetota bacterium]|nr:adenine-specific methyltransferase EcoRI family protein [Planctomycetota bacterium]
MPSKSLNQGLGAAKAAKQDEFYTQYVDIQKEVEAYLELDSETFRGKVVYCNCDDPFESNFFKYFAANFNKLGLKTLITTSYDGSPIAGQGTLFPEYDEGNGKRQKPKALAVILHQVKDEDGDGAANVTDVELFLKRNKAARIALKGSDKYPGGDFRSPECVDFLKEAAIVVTNPPFSLFREYVTQLMEHGKKLVIIGPKNATTYKEIFPLIKETKLWLGSGFANGNAYFSIPDHGDREFADGVYDESTGLVKFRNVGWFTNLDHGRRHQKLPLMTMSENLKFSKHKDLKGKPAYDRYDNYDAIEVPFTDAIPSDYAGVMGVPISFLDKYNPEQFEIVGTTESNDRDNAYRTRVYTSQECREGYSRRFGKPGVYDLNASGVVDGVKVFKRVLIRHRRRTKGKKK